MRLSPLVIALLLAAGGFVPPAHAADLSAQQSAAEEQQEALRQRIESLQKEIDKRESDRQEAADALRVSETAISRLNRRLTELSTERAQVQGQLNTLHQGIREQEGVLAKRREELAVQLRAQYASGLSPWTALLSGDDAQELGRNLGYLDYISQARARTVSALQADIDRLAQLQAQADNRSTELARVAAEIETRKGELVGQQKERATVLARLEGQIAAQRSEATRLGRDDQRLSRLLDGLEVAIVEQAKRAEEARREAAEQARLRAEEIRRKAQAAREADEKRRSAESARLAQQAQDAAREAAQAREQAEAAIAKSRAEPRGGLIEARGPLIASEARGSLARSAPTPEATGGGGLSRGLTPPVQGEVQGRFGVGRPDGGTWRGIVLRAAEGTPVHVVAPGTVVYSQWLRGFGNLIIVDHGAQFMTVYGYNQSLQKQVGDKVKAGETIAAVGATGGQVESGLYFEIRHQGAPVDPAQWLAR
ncbi:MAG: peptidase [Comamonadaceae bacterium]|nr:MAG: peptidase [Comamonadaceae bacterium]